ncbi:DEP domain-containing protein 4 isoform X3 [Scyliorhinus canicula]|uniref:DEP domain-containing protein 4 isoform X3 n=1 Tax=Scyliorhinus canicula TaxID=7830 RepID=UPI0018F6ED93|nr:DEP domain-containing protein 4 isoform X3 [Scyliorhinus canicula]
MALNLTPRFRRLGSRSSLRRKTGHLEPFYATQLWNNIIHALQTQVDSKQQRWHWRMHNDCFTGADAVDVVLSHLMQNVYFSSNDISRLKAARLCQTLMDHKVFYPVGSRLFSKEQKMMFEDRSSSLYKFMDSCALPGAEKDHEMENLLCHERLEPKRKFPETNKITFLNPVALEAHDKRINELLKMINLHPSLSPNPKRKRPTTLLSKKDEWFMVAVDCLEYFPDELIVHASELLSQIVNDREMVAESHKRVLFDTIARHYSQNREPLLYDRYHNIYTGIIKLRESGNSGRALEAAQLCVRLLEPNWREELHRLLSFMAVAAAPSAYKLQKQNMNKTVIRRTFTKAIIQNKSLPKTQAEELVLFLMDNHTAVFKIPDSLLQMVRKKLLLLQEGGDPDTSTGFTFCQHISQKEFDEQKNKTTMDQLQQLVEKINQNSNMSVKERNILLHEFQKHHPLVFLQHF